LFFNLDIIKALYKKNLSLLAKVARIIKKKLAIVVGKHHHWAFFRFGHMIGAIAPIM
jgi:hypothetical protein